MKRSIEEAARAMATARRDEGELREQALRVVRDLEARGLVEDAAVVRDLMARVESVARDEAHAPAEPERTYSVAEAAFMMGVAESLAAQLCEQGRLDARRDEQGEWRVPASRFVHTPEEVRRIEAMWAEIERERKVAGIPDMTDEEFMKELRQHDEEERATGSAQ